MGTDANERGGLDIDYRKERDLIGGSNKLLTMKEASEYLGVPHRTLQEYWHAWQLPAYRIGKRVQFRVRDLDSYIEQHRAA